jgi:hypothetical protein
MPSLDARDSMPIATGAMLIKDGTVLPEPSLQGASYSSGWKSVTDIQRRDLEKQLDQAGWTFFYTAGQIKTSAFGFDEQKRTRTAVRKALQDAQSQACNCLEIDDVTRHSFLGLPYVSVSAHTRHIQNVKAYRGR